MKFMDKPNQTKAFGWPGIEPRWTHGGKDGVGTAYAASSRVWFTFWNGIVTEVYYPTVDRPQLRDLQYLITDGKSFFHDEKRHLKSKLEQSAGPRLGIPLYEFGSSRAYAIVKEIIADPHLACVLQHTRLPATNRSSPSCGFTPCAHLILRSEAGATTATWCAWRAERC
jgi:glucoamylase